MADDGWGKPPYGGDRPQRGFIERLGETAPNAVLLRGWGKPPPTRFY